MTKTEIYYSVLCIFDITTIVYRHLSIHWIAKVLRICSYSEHIVLWCRTVHKTLKTLPSMSPLCKYSGTYIEGGFVIDKMSRVKSLGFWQMMFLTSSSWVKACSVSHILLSNYEDNCLILNDLLTFLLVSDKQVWQGKCVATEIALSFLQVRLQMKGPIPKHSLASNARPIMFQLQNR